MNFMLTSSWPLTARIIVLSLVLGLGGGILGAALTTSSLADYAAQLGERSMRINEYPLGMSSALLTKLREALFPASVQFFAAKADVTDAAQADRQGVVLTSDGWLAFVPEGGRAPAFAVIGRRAYVVKRSVADPLSGVLFVKVDAKNVSAIGFGSAFSLAAGDTVFALVGRETLRAGEVIGVHYPLQMSADRLGRRIMLVASLGAPIVSSSSGDLLGFAGPDALIPTEAFLPAFRALLKEGKIIRPSIGFSYTDRARSILLPSDLASAPESGMRVVSVLRGGAAEAAGLKTGDTVFMVDGDVLDALHTFDQHMLAATPGQTMVLTVERAGIRRDLNIKLGPSTL